MKYFLFLFVFILSFSSCNKDDDSNSNGDQIVGNWGNYKDTFIDGSGNEILEGEWSDPFWEIWNVKSDGTLTVQEILGGNSLISGTWRYNDGNNYTLILDGEDLTSNIYFLCNENILKVDVVDGFYYYTRTSYDFNSCDED